MRTKAKAVAREAARLLYFGIVEEYKDAKISAAKSLGIRALPSNYDVAIELDHLADELEGEEREKLLLRLRREALELMNHLASFQPRLIGSVWRGTARKQSDIDIEVYALSIDDVIRRLDEDFEITKAEWTSKTSEGETARFYHIFVHLPTGDEAEISVKTLEDVGERRRDAVYADEVTGLNIEQLEEILHSSPLRRFVPEKKKGRRAKR
jgi:predicted nucleotidyltransferase